MKPPKKTAVIILAVVLSCCLGFFALAFLGSLLPKSATPTATGPAPAVGVTFVPTLRPIATDAVALPTPLPPTPIRTDAPAATLAPQSTATRRPPTVVPATAAPTVPPAPTATSKPAAPAAVSFGDGMYVVGQDIPPGTYRNRATGSCYWERLKGFGGSLDEIVANSASRGPIVVTILPTDKGFHSRGCGVLSQDLSAITPSPASPFGDGTYIVNTDVAPGRWRSDGTGSCYWERLKSFGGTLDEIITNNASTGPSIVEIAPGDRGFHSSGCGKWTKN